MFKYSILLVAFILSLPVFAQEDMLSDEYYLWTETTRTELAEGVVYSHCSWVNVPRSMHVLENGERNMAIRIAGALPCSRPGVGAVRQKWGKKLFELHIGEKKAIES